MTDTTFTFNFDNNPLGSPNPLINKPMEDYLQYQDYEFTLPTLKYQCHQMYQPNGVESHENAENPTTDTLSNSGSYPSSKYSPEYQYQTESDEKSTKNSKIPPIIRKGIHKYYEPIEDGDATFLYEDDPSEYKKARKRIQNRESATRVRNRKKNYTEELEIELQKVRNENSHLKTRNSEMAAENHLLKQQITFLETIVNTKNEEIQLAQSPYRQQDYDYFLPIDDQVKEEDSPLENALSPKLDFGYSRVNPKSTFSKHVTILGVLTMIICTYAMLSTVGSSSGVEGRGFLNTISGPATNSGLNHGAKEIAFKSANPLNFNWQQSLHFVIRKMEDTEFLMTAAQYFFGIGYVVYIIYVLLLMNWGYLTNKAKRV